MKGKAITLAELDDSAIRILCREFGVVNATRFIQQFTTGYGNYTEERDQIIGDETVDEIAADIERRRQATRHKRPN